MGLLEKALHYKNRINGRGKKTIMDRIAGPADTGTPIPDGDFTGNSSQDGEEPVVYLARDDLVSVNDDGVMIPGENRPGGDAIADIEGRQSRDGEEAARAPRIRGIDPEGGQGFGTEKDFPNRRRADETGAGLMDYMALHEVSKDILRVNSMEELFDVILFTVMGQIGVSSSSILVKGHDNSADWEIAESRGVTINRDEVDFRPGTGILKELIGRKDIIDIEEFKEDAEPGDDYYSYIAIDARILVPLIWMDEVLGAIILGNKLTADEYPEDEKAFLRAIAEYSAFSYRALKLKEMNETGGGPGSHVAAADRIHGKMAAERRISRIRNVIQDEFGDMGIEGYGIFVRDENRRDYELFVGDPGNRLQMTESRFRIPARTGLVQEITHAESPILFNDVRRSKTLVEVFSDRQLSVMEVLDLFTFKMGGEMLGFVMVYGFLESAHLDTIHARLIKFVDFIFPSIVIARGIEYGQGNYIDTIERVFHRIDDEIANARELRIPVTIVLFTIKNFKRFHAMFGQEKAKAMFDHFEVFIQSRISDRDFSVRYDRHKMLLVLPGKDRKYATPLANALCTEMTRTFSTREVQLLMTFLSAEYPVDGKDGYTLVDSVN